MNYDEILISALSGRYPTTQDIARLETPPGQSRNTFETSLLSALSRIFSATTPHAARNYATQAATRHRTAWGADGPPRPSTREDHQP
ncbi:MAG: hypothetical protein JWM02_3514 [Frankiales bacterium]|nr:hypothetical protein [Frankiales bacterium]